MGRRGMLGKLKFMVKKYSQGGGRSSCSTPRVDEEEEQWKKSQGEEEEEVPLGLHPVYVGKSRRRYLISSRLVDHPLLRVLVQRCGDGATTPTAVVGCEVVLFDHLLWMIENADPQPESLDELIEFYAV